MHVPSTCNIHPRKFLDSIVMAMSRFVKVPNLVSLAQKFIKSEDPTFENFYPSGTC